MCGNVDDEDAHNEDWYKVDKHKLNKYGVFLTPRANVLSTQRPLAFKFKLTSLPEKVIG